MKAIVTIVLLNLYVLVSFAQVKVLQIGNNSSCKIDTQTTQVYLPATKKEEGYTFIVNLDGKTCSSGKASHPDDHQKLLKELNLLKKKGEISDTIYRIIKKSLIKNKEIIDYIKNNPESQDQEVILSILNQ